ncbi:unnamed protein product, partial [Effrenium voratum]
FLGVRSALGRRAPIARAVAQADEAKQAEVQQEIAQLEERAAAGEADAQFRLGQVFRKGRQAEQDLVRAFQLIYDASQQDHMRAQYVLGLMLIRGEGCEEDVDLGVSFVLMAAEARSRRRRTSSRGPIG